jgi:hypothetical protein
VARSEERAAADTRTRRGGLPAAVLAAAVVLATGCTGSVGDPPSRSVSGGEVRLDVSPSFRSTLSEYGLQMVWSPPQCSWRLAAPACGGAATGDAASVVIPVVGGEVSVWERGQKVRGRVQLAGHLELTGPRASLPLDDLTVQPETSVLTAGTPTGRIDALFLDGTAATFSSAAGVVQVTGVEVKLLRGLNDQIRSLLGVAQSAELVKVGELAMTVNTGPRPGASG